MCLVSVQFDWELVVWLARPGISRRYLDQQGCTQAARASLSANPGIVFTM
ncbi:hypothetical protein GCM10009085_50170 [Pseudomonas avellanae]|nr:hypothetical protein GCM10009085_50170 [Pseudomonas avellanae]